MANPVVQQTLTDLLPSNIQLMFGLVKAGGAVIDRNSQTITLDVPYTYSRAEIESMRSQVEQWKEQYKQQVIQMNPDSEAEVVATNELAQFNNALKIYDQLLQVMI